MEQRWRSASARTRQSCCCRSELCQVDLTYDKDALHWATMTTSILPESVQPGEHYSFKADLKLNAWAFVAVVAAFTARWVLQRHHDWSAALASLIALSPLLPSLLYARAVARWIGGMDELQRRLQMVACLIATTGTVFIATGLSLLGSSGVLTSARLQHGLGWEGTFAVIVLLYVLGNVVVNRRYR